MSEFQLGPNTFTAVLAIVGLLAVNSTLNKAFGWIKPLTGMVAEALKPQPLPEGEKDPYLDSKAYTYQRFTGRITLYAVVAYSAVRLLEHVA